MIKTAGQFLSNGYENNCLIKKCFGEVYQSHGGGISLSIKEGLIDIVRQPEPCCGGC